MHSADSLFFSAQFYRISELWKQDQYLKIYNLKSFMSSVFFMWDKSGEEGRWWLWLVQSISWFWIENVQLLGLVEKIWPHYFLMTGPHHDIATIRPFITITSFSRVFLVHLKILNLNVNPIGHRNRSHDKTESIVFYIRDLYHLHNSCLHSTLFILGSSGVIFKPAGHPFVCPQNKSLCCSFHLHIFYSFCQETAEQIDQL